MAKGIPSSMYATDERIKSSVCAAQVGKMSMRAEYERDRHRCEAGEYRTLKPDFDKHSFSLRVATITGVIESMCRDGTRGWEVVSRLVSRKPKASDRLFQEQVHPPPIVGRSKTVRVSSFGVIRSELGDTKGRATRSWLEERVVSSSLNLSSD